MAALGALLGGQPQPWPEMVQAHDAVRAKLNLPPLVWSDKLAAVAQQWADRLVARNEFIHRPKSAYGENMFKIIGSPTSPARVVREWASEVADFDYASNRCKRVCGHYTQIVWRGTKELGCGVARKGRTEIWVCDYNPPGNWVGQRPY
jgi:pathogenesis-related protein 1